MMVELKRMGLGGERGGGLKMFVGYLGHFRLRLRLRSPRFDYFVS